MPPPRNKKPSTSETKQLSTPRSLPATPANEPRLDYCEEELLALDKSDLVEKLLAVQSYTTSIRSQLDTLTAKVESMSGDVDILKKNKERKNEAPGSSKVDERVTKLEKQLFASEQYSRRDTIEIVGIPENIADKDIESKAIGIMKMIGVTVPKQEIQACHRLVKKDRVIIKFVNRKTAIACLRSRSKLKDANCKSLGLPDKCRLYVNESLCPAYRKLFWKCKLLFKESKIQSCWTYNGTIKVKLTNDDVYSILHDDDITSLKL